MRFILFLAANAIAMACGAGLISVGWLVATFAIDYVRAIFTEGENAPGGNFRNLSNDDFGKSEANIKMKTVRNLAASVAFFGAGYVAILLDWV